MDYEKLNLVQPYVADLRKLSKADIATNQDFIYIRQDIDEFQKMQADNTVTLNERDALKERRMNEARQKARDAERAARKPANEKIYEITVENSHQPGLPPPDALITTNGVTDNFDSNFTNYLGTNAAAMITSQKAEVKTLPSDPTLNETENILEEYISLLHRVRSSLIGNQHPVRRQK